MTDSTHTITVSEERRWDIRVWWKRLLDGWPVYAAMAVFLFGYSELWIDKKIAEGVKAATGADVPKDIALLRNDVEDLEGSVDSLDDSVKELNQDVKAVLLHLAGQ